MFALTQTLQFDRIPQAGCSKILITQPHKQYCAAISRNLQDCTTLYSLGAQPGTIDNPAWRCGPHRIRITACQCCPLPCAMQRTEQAGVWAGCQGLLAHPIER